MNLSNSTSWSSGMNDLAVSSLSAFFMPFALCASHSTSLLKRYSSDSPKRVAGCFKCLNLEITSSLGISFLFSSSIYYDSLVMATSLSAYFSWISLIFSSCFLFFSSSLFACSSRYFYSLSFSSSPYLTQGVEDVWGTACFACCFNFDVRSFRAASDFILLIINIEKSFT